MLPTLLFDLDGVILLKKGYFSEKFAKDFNLSQIEVTQFFKTEFPKCSIGKEDLKTAVTPYLKKWGWQKSADDFLNYWFESDFFPNTPLIILISQLKQKNYPIYIATNQEKYRAGYLENKLNFTTNFNGAFISWKMGLNKSQPEFYAHILESLRIPAQQIVFIDDDPKHLKIANSLGIQTILYKSADVFKFLQSML